MSRLFCRSRLFCLFRIFCHVNQIVGNYTSNSFCDKSSRSSRDEGDRFVVPWYLKGGTWYKEPVRCLGRGKLVPNWPKLVEPIQNHDFLCKSLKRLSGRKLSQDLLKQGEPLWDEDGQKVRKQLSIFDLMNLGYGLGTFIFRNCHGKHPLDVEKRCFFFWKGNSRFCLPNVQRTPEKIHVLLYI